MISTDDLALIQARATALQAYIDEIKPIASSDPGWYFIALKALRWQCGATDQQFKILEEGSAKFPDFYQLYFEVVLDGLRCRQSEPKALIEKIVALAVDRTKAQDGQGMYARIFWVLAKNY